MIAAGTGLVEATITVGEGRTLRYVHAGEGGPVVVFEAGLGACASSWVTVQRLVSSKTSTVSYDRAGHAGSTPDSHPRSLSRIGEDLHELLAHVSPDEPVVLVAHSWGGPIVRAYCSSHPERVAGLVMIDTTPSTAFSPLAAKGTVPSFRLMRLLHRVGMGEALIRRKLGLAPSAELPADDLDLFWRDSTSPSGSKTSIAEAKAIAPSLQLIRQWEADGLPHVPTTFLTAAGKTAKEQKMREEKLLPAYQAEIERHPHAVRRHLSETGHLIPQERPRATAAAILEVVHSARSR